MNKIKLELASMNVRPFAILLAEHGDDAEESVTSMIEKFVQNVLFDGVAQNETNKKFVYSYKMSGDHSRQYDFYAQPIADFISDYAETTTGPRGVEHKYFYQDGKLCYWDCSGNLQESAVMSEEDFKDFMYSNAIEQLEMQGNASLGLCFSLYFEDTFKHAVDLETEEILECRD